MDARQRYLFDLQGYLTIPNALSAEQLACLNAVLDQRIATDWDASSATKRFGNVLRWDASYREHIANPAVVPVLQALLGDDFRLDHCYLDVIRSGTSPIGATLHGGATPFDPAQYYQVHGDRMHSGLTVVAFNLVDVYPGDGGFACVPGSHKANFTFPSEWRDLTDPHPCVERVTGPAGTAIIFTEALTHGPLPWLGDHERRTLFLKYCPRPLAYSGAYPDAGDYAQFPDLGEASKSALDRPAAFRLQRPVQV
jgi:hypothetical protein